MYNIRLQPGEKIIGYCESVYDCSASFDSDITGELFMTNKNLIFVESEEIRIGSLFSNPFRNKASKEKQKTEYISLKSILLTNGVTQVFLYNNEDYCYLQIYYNSSMKLFRFEEYDVEWEKEVIRWIDWIDVLLTGKPMGCAKSNRSRENIYCIDLQPDEAVLGFSQRIYFKNSGVIGELYLTNKNLIFFSERTLKHIIPLNSIKVIQGRAQVIIHIDYSDRKTYLQVYHYGGMDEFNISDDTVRSWINCISVLVESAQPKNIGQNAERIRTVPENCEYNANHNDENDEAEQLREEVERLKHETERLQDEAKRSGKNSIKQGTSDSGRGIFAGTFKQLKKELFGTASFHNPNRDSAPLDSIQAVSPNTVNVDYVMTKPDYGENRQSSGVRNSDTAKSLSQSQLKVRCCKRCGTILSDGQRFCSKCGYDMNN